VSRIVSPSRKDFIKKMRSLILSLIVALSSVSYAGLNDAALGQLTLAGDVRISLGEQEAFTQTGGTAVLTADSTLFALDSESAVKFANGDSAILGQNTLVTLDGQSASPEMNLVQGSIALHREANSALVLKVGDLYVFAADESSELTGFFTIKNEKDVQVRSFGQGIILVDENGFETEVKPNSRVLVELSKSMDEQKTRIVMTQDDTLIGNPDVDDLNDETVVEDEDDDQGAYFMQDGGGDEALFSLFGLGTAASVAVAGAGAAAVVGTGVAIENNNDDSSGGTSNPPTRRIQISEIAPNDNPGDELPERFRGIVCP
jgi:uncharacterized cupin superfamily protein